MLATLIDQAAIRDVIVSLALALDAKDWATCEAYLLPEFSTDYGDLRGEAPQQVRAADYVAQRQRALTPLLTQHLSTNHRIQVRADAAWCTSQAVIYRFSGAGPDEFFHTHCTYEHRLIRTAAGWKISHIKQMVVQNLGNSALHAGAAAVPTPVS